jgi:tellurite resistance protein
MVEIVARAINPTAFQEAIAPENQSQTMQNYYAVICGKARAAARAAIEAMRTPTEAMVDAGAVAEGDGNLEAEARSIWDAMISVAAQPAD